MAINFYYQSHVTQELVIDEDNQGLFVKVPSERQEICYKVRCHESKTSVNVESCSCKGYSYYHRCKHVEIVQSYWNRLYPQVETPKVVETPVAKARKPRNGLVRKVRNGGLVRVEQPAKVVETPVQPAKITDISQKGNFGTRAFSLMR
jgi:hypothetical protein